METNNPIPAQRSISDAPPPRRWPRPNNHLKWAVLAALFCNLPLGIASIIFSSQVDTKYDAGNDGAAYLAADRALLLARCALGLLVVNIVFAVAFGLALSPRALG